MARERSYIFWLLARTDYSRKKLETKLRDRKTLSPEQIKDLLDKMEEQKYFQPAAFLRTRTRSLARKGYSASGISYRLREDGVSESATSVGTMLDEQGIEADAGLKAMVEKARRKCADKKVPETFMRRCLTRGHRYADVLKAWKQSFEE